MSRKSLNQILKQTSFTGADVGKATLLTLVDRFLGKGGGLSDNDISLMTSSIINPTQAAICRAYATFGLYLESFNSIQLGNYQKFYHGLDHLLLILSRTYHIIRRYLDYLNSPLILPEAEYNTYREKAKKAYYSRKYSLEELIKELLHEAVDRYMNDKELGPFFTKLAPVFKKYSSESIETDRLTPYWNLSPKELIAKYADLYHVNKDMNTLLPFILDRISTDKHGEKMLKQEAIDEILEPLPQLSIQATQEEKEAVLAKFIIRDIKQTIDTHRTENEKKLYLEQIEGQKVEWNSVRDSEDAADLFYTYKNEKTDKLAVFYEDIPVEETPLKDIKKAYPELADTIDTLEKALAKGKRSPNTKYTIEAVAPLGIDQDYLLDLAAETEELVSAAMDKPKCSQKDYIRAMKAIYGIAIAPEGTEAPEIPRWALDFDIMKDPSQDLDLETTPDGDSVNNCIEYLVKPAVIGLYGFNDFLDAFGDRLKVDLSSLKVDMKQLVRKVDSYNKLVYLIAYSLLDAPEGNPVVEKNKPHLKAMLKPLDITTMRTDPERIAALKKELEYLPLDECIDPKYFNPFFEGGNVIIEK